MEKLIMMDEQVSNTIILLIRHPTQQQNDQHFINYFKQISSKPILFYDGKKTPDKINKQKTKINNHYIFVTCQTHETEQLLPCTDYVVDFVNTFPLKHPHYFNISSHSSAWRIEHAARRIANKTIGIALCSGGAPGVTHLGVLKVFQDEKIPLDYIVGSSAGAMCGACYAAGIPLDHALTIIKKEAKPSTFTIALKNPSFNLKGIMNGNYLLTILQNLYGDKKIEDAKIPFAAVASDLISGEAVVYKRGKFVDAVRASSSIPFLINPIEDNNRLIIDGVATEPLPVNILEQEKIDIKIAVPVPQLDLVTSIDMNANLFTIYSRTYSMLIEQLVNYSKRRADIIIAPHVEGIKLLEWKKLDQIVQAGEDAARNSVNEIKKALKRVTT